MAKNSTQKTRQGVINYFNQNYGTNDTRLASWQKLCRDVGANQGNSINQCKKNLRGKYVHIIDFVAAKEAGIRVQTFPSAWALSEHMKTSPNKIFPKEMAKQNPILRWMLITIR